MAKMNDWWRFISEFRRNVDATIIKHPVKTPFQERRFRRLTIYYGRTFLFHRAKNSRVAGLKTYNYVRFDRSIYSL
jgi:hypothetical protein